MSSIEMFHSLSDHLFFGYKGVVNQKVCDWIWSVFERRVVPKLYYSAKLLESEVLITFFICETLYCFTIGWKSQRLRPEL